MVENEIEYSMAAIKQNFLRAGSKLESTGISEDTMRQDLKPAAEEKVKEELILGKIADLEDTKLEDNDIMDGFSEIGCSNRANLHYYFSNTMKKQFNGFIQKSAFN